MQGKFIVSIEPDCLQIRDIQETRILVSIALGGVIPEYEATQLFIEAISQHILALNPTGRKEEP